MQRVALGRSLLIAGFCGLLPLLGNVAASFVTDWTGAATWLVAPVVAVSVAMISELAQAFRQPPPAPPAPAYRHDVGAHRPPPAGQARRGTPLPVALLIAILVLGVGGWALTQGVRYAVGYFTGNETGTERLRKPVRASVNGLTLTVRSVEDTAHFTRVSVTARNETGNSLTLPLFGNCRFIGGDGTTLEANSFKSRWSEGISSGGVQRGTITFDGHLANRVRRATLAFSTVFRQGFSGPQSIAVTDISLRRGSN